MAAIEILALEKRYLVGFWRKREKTALRPLSLMVEDGEVFGYLGPNGAGKTTTLKLLMSLVFPTSGSARILNLDYTDPAVKARVGYLPEQPYFYDQLTAPELLEYYAQLSGVAARDRKRRVHQMLERVGLPDVGRMQLRKFSKGMLQRVGIAQAILHDPAVVFLDEPMSGLDPIGRREVRDLISELKDEGKTVFFSTHILSDAEALCDRVAILHKGELRGTGAVADLTGSVRARVEVLYIGSSATSAVKELGAEVRATGETIRAVLPDNQLDAAIDAIRSAKAKLVAVTPVRTTLEDYFVANVRTDAPSNMAKTTQAAESRDQSRVFGART
jgi:ABC-2 type transport system ATP-binding protein